MQRVLPSRFLAASFIFAAACSGNGSGNSSGSSSGSSGGATGGSSAGSGSTSSAGSGSSSGAGSTADGRVHAIHGASQHTADIKVCAQGGSSAPWIVIAADLAYGQASSFVDGTANSSSTIKVVATTDACDTGTALASLPGVDLSGSTTGELISIIVHDDGTNLAIFAALQNPASDPQHKAEIYLADAFNPMASGDPIDFALALPFTPVASGVTPDGGGSGGGFEIPPIPSNYLTVTTQSSLVSYQFPTFQADAAKRYLVLPIGTEDSTTTPPALLICDVTAAAACTTIPHTPTAFIRIANLLPASDPNELSYFWIGTDTSATTTEYTAVDTTDGLTPGQVGPYFPRTIGPNHSNAHVVATTTTTAPTRASDGSAVGAYVDFNFADTTSNGGFTQGSYVTIVFGKPANTYSMVQVAAAPAITTLDRTDIVQSAMISDIGGSSSVSVPKMFNTPLAQSLPASGSGVTTSESHALWSQVGSFGDFQLVDANGNSLTFPTFGNAFEQSNTVSLFFGGERAAAFAVICSNIGDQDGNGNSNCAISYAPVTAVPAPANPEPAFTRVANMWTGAVDLCVGPLGPNGAAVIATIASHALGQFVATADVGEVAPTGSCTGTSNLALSLTAGSFNTVLAYVGSSGLAATSVAFAPPSPVRSVLKVNAINALESTTLTYTAGGAGGASIPGGAGFDITTTFPPVGSFIAGTELHVSDGGTNDYFYIIPNDSTIFGGGIYTLFTVPDSASTTPITLWCIDNASLPQTPCEQLALSPQ